MNIKFFFLFLIAIVSLIFSFSLFSQTPTFAGKMDGLLNSLESKGFAPIAKTGQTISSELGDDGYWQAGIPFPEPRFTDNKDGTVTDNMTGLMWTIDAQQIQGYMTWFDALIECNDLEFAGYDDWRMPNVREMLSLIDYGSRRPALTPDHPFINVESYPGVYWSSTTYAGSNDVFHVAISNGTINHVGKLGSKYVWPVRSDN